MDIAYRQLIAEAPGKIMSLKSWLRNERGEWYVAIQVVLMVLAFFAHHVDRGEQSSLLMVAGVALCVVGLVFAVAGLVGLGKSLSPYPKPRETGELTESGAYSIVRHPIYAGIILFAFGWALVWASWLTFVAAIVLLVFFDLKARREERWLASKFSDYSRYRQRVRKLIPFIY